MQLYEFQHIHRTELNDHRATVYPGNKKPSNCLSNCATAYRIVQLHIHLCNCISPLSSSKKLYRMTSWQLHIFWCNCESWRSYTLALLALKEWNIFKIFHLFKQSEIQLFKIYLKLMVRTEVFGHIGFEAKLEMKPYYNIVHKAIKVAILRQLRQFFSRWSHPCEW